jgi:AcrR family transcriptional regulator
MVSQSIPSPTDRTSRDRLLAAAAVEFAARGFDGAKVDRIARRARVNKAMVYYHFKNKADLYREILHELFRSLAAAVAAARAAGGPPVDQLRRYIDAMASESARRPHFPSLWLREMAEGGRHLDASVILDLASVLGVLAAIMRDGRHAGEFGDAHPFVVQMGIVAPLLLFAASAPIRERFVSVFPSHMAAIRRDDVIAYVEACALAALKSSAGRPASARAVARTRRRSV